MASGDVRIFSNLRQLERNSTNASGTLKRRRCLAVGSFECGAEMAMAGKTEIERQGGQIDMGAEQVKRPGQPQLQLVAIEREALDLLEYLSEIDGRDADLSGDRRQG